MHKNYTPKDELTKRLAGYAITAGATLLLGSAVEGQVVYSGLVDSLVYGPDSNFNLDMNNDGITDFNFHLSSNHGASSYFGDAMLRNARTGSYANSFAFVSTYGPFAFDEGEMINGSLSFRYQPNNYVLGFVYKYSIGYSTFSSTTGNFIGAEEKYIGVRFHIGTSQHYGWIRISIPEDVGYLNILDWAYESTPNLGIHTGSGQSSTGADTRHENVQAFPNPVQSTLYLKSYQPASFSLLTLDGKLLLKKSNITSGELDMSDFTSGIYILKTCCGNDTFYQKIIKQ